MQHVVGHCCEHTISCSLYEDLVKLIVLPLAFEGTDAKKGAVSRSIRIADNMENAVMERYVVGLIMAFADKVNSAEARAGRVMADRCLVHKT